jgi:hypothetical protein
MRIVVRRGALVCGVLVVAGTAGLLSAPRVEL